MTRLVRSIEETAVMLDMGIGSVRELIDRGQLEYAVTPGGKKTVVSLVSILEFLGYREDVIRGVVERALEPASGSGPPSSSDSNDRASVERPEAKPRRGAIDSMPSPASPGTGSPGTPPRLRLASTSPVSGRRASRRASRQQAEVDRTAFRRISNATRERLHDATGH